MRKASSHQSGLLALVSSMLISSQDFGESLDMLGRGLSRTVRDLTLQSVASRFLLPLAVNSAGHGPAQSR
jgi:hypothetical protein